MYDYSWPDLAPGRPRTPTQMVVVRTFGGNPEPTRPALGDEVWREVDRALDEAVRACRRRSMVLLGATDAETMARGVYVIHEGGPGTVDLVAAIGHADRTVSYCVTDSLIPQNKEALDALLGDAERALRGGDLAGALRAIAPAVARFR